MSAFRKHIETIYPASYKSTIERLNREHRVHRILIKTTERSCSGSQGEVHSPEESPQDRFLRGTMHEDLENKAADPQPVAIVGRPSFGWLIHLNPSTHSSFAIPLIPAPCSLLCVSKPVIDTNTKTEATNCSQLTWTQTTASLIAHCWKT